MTFFIIDAQRIPCLLKLMLSYVHSLRLTHTFKTVSFGRGQVPRKEPPRGKELAFIAHLLCARVDWGEEGRQEGGAVC